MDTCRYQTQSLMLTQVVCGSLRAHIQMTQTSWHWVVSTVFFSGKPSQKWRNKNQIFLNCTLKKIEIKTGVKPAKRGQNAVKLVERENLSLFFLK